jgi:outer-membrane receptor for ferric coprogen and ferric-rhodotorulic acid
MRAKSMLGAVLAALMLCAAPAHAQGVPLDLPALDLNRALERLAEATGMQVLYPSALTEGLRSAPLRGHYTLDEALQRLLDGTGLGFRRTPDGAILIEREAADPRQIGTLLVAGTQIQRRGAGGSTDMLATEGRGSYAAPGAAVGGPNPQPLKDVARAVTVIGQAQIRDQGIVELSDAVQRLPGVAVVGHAGASINALSRGHSLQFLQIDGSAPMPFPIQRISGDLSPYDRVELLRGADGIGDGFAPPSGILNLVRKRPLDAAQLVVEAGAGSWNHYRGMLDASAPLAWDGRLRARTVISGVDRETFYDRGFEQRASYYGIVEADLAPATLLGIGAHYADQRGTPWEVAGLPFYENGAPVDLPRSTSFIPPWNFEQTRTRQIFGYLEQDFGPDWTLRLGAMRWSEDRDALQSLIGGRVDPETGDGLSFFSIFRVNEDRHTLADLKLNGRFRWLGRDQVVSLNLHHARYEQFENYLITDFTEDPVEFNVFDYDPYSWPRVSLDPEFFDEPTDVLQRYGGSLAFTLRPWGPLGVVAAWRWSERSNRSVFIPTDDEKARDRRRGLSYLALTWALDERWNAYASWADAYVSNDALLTESGGHPAPTVGDNYEAGIKYGAPDGSLNAMFAVYRTELGNFPQQLESSEPRFRCCFVNSKDVRERLHGVEAELAGMLLPRWQLVAGYSYGSNRFHGEGYTVPTTGLAETIVDTLTPRHNVRLWVIGQPAAGGAWRPLRLRSGLTLDPDYGPIRAHGYSVVDVLVGWRPADAGWEAALNVRNLLDRHYYAATDVLGRPLNFYGEPRSLVLTLRSRL